MVMLALKIPVNPTPVANIMIFIVMTKILVLMMPVIPREDVTLFLKSVMMVISVLWTNV
jgi:hypothetical protein